MTTQTGTLTVFSEAMAEQRSIMVFLIFSSLCIGSFIGLQLDQYIDIACAVRGTCYGDEGLIHSASLVHPMIFKLLFSSMVVMIFALLLKTATPFEKLKSTGFYSENNVTQLKNLGTVLFILGGIFLMLCLPLMVYSMSI